MNSSLYGVLIFHIHLQINIKIKVKQQYLIRNSVRIALSSYNWLGRNDIWMTLRLTQD